MDIIQKMQFKERITGTLLRLGWLVSLITFVPALLYLMYEAIEVGKILYLAVLVLVALCTLFLIFLNESFRNAFNAQAADILPMVQKVYSSYKILIYVFLIIGLVLAVLTILFAIKENNGRASKKRIISSGCMAVVLLIGFIVYMATKSSVMGVAL